MINKNNNRNKILKTYSCFSPSLNILFHGHAIAVETRNPTQSQTSDSSPFPLSCCFPMHQREEGRKCVRKKWKMTEREKE